MHTLLDLRGSIPSFIHVSNGKLHDLDVLDLPLPDAGAFYVMNRGYIDFVRLYILHQAGAFFVTRAKSNLDAPGASHFATDSVGNALRENARPTSVPRQGLQLGACPVL